MTEKIENLNTLKRKSPFNCAHATYATGKRKTAVAKIWIKPGNGSYTVRSENTYGDLHSYFSEVGLREKALRPFKFTETLGAFDVFVSVSGGGVSSQATAVSNGISKAMSLYNHDSYYLLLRNAGMITRDSRAVEPKKIGFTKARRTPQSSKR